MNNTKIAALACCTIGQARAAARKIYLSERYVCRISKLSTGESAVTLPGVPVNESETIFSNLFTEDLSNKTARISRGYYESAATAIAVTA